MRNPDYVYEFAKGALSPMAVVPAWLSDAMTAEKASDDRQKALSDAGADHVESYGYLNETLDVWKMEDQGWVVDYWDTTSQVFAVVIENLGDFMMFQATWIAPMALKIMAADKYLAERGSDFQPDEPEVVEEPAELPARDRRVKVPALH
jgi:hypothetical protein